ncbi:MAG: hypothetical protein JST17_15395 [Bacteroidetes bacterium]|nr:hypothetical protein [Bacteroidota bacterium]MBS1930569.1 hypothetical protein [Bacteroidota bacterium]
MKKILFLLIAIAFGTTYCFSQSSVQIKQSHQKKASTKHLTAVSVSSFKADSLAAKKLDILKKPSLPVIKAALRKPTILKKKSTSFEEKTLLQKINSIIHSKPGSGRENFVINIVDAYSFCNSMDHLPVNSSKYFNKINICSTDDAV